MTDMPLRRGIHPVLEAEANRIIAQSLKGVTKHSDKADILTPWKEQDRLRREVYVTDGVPDPATRKGIFHRATNPARPELNSRDGVARPRSRTGSLMQHVEASTGDEDWKTSAATEWIAS